MSARAITIEPAAQPVEVPTGVLLVATGALILGAALVAALLAVILHHLAKRASLKLRAVIAGIIPVALILVFMSYAYWQVTGEFGVDNLAATATMELRGFVILGLVAGSGVFAAWLTSRSLARRAERRAFSNNPTFE